MKVKTVIVLLLIVMIVSSCVYYTSQTVNLVGEISFSLEVTNISRGRSINDSSSVLHCEPGDSIETYVVISDYDSSSTYYLTMAFYDFQYKYESKRINQTVFAIPDSIKSGKYPISATLKIIYSNKDEQHLLGREQEITVSSGDSLRVVYTIQVE